MQPGPFPHPLILLIPSKWVCYAFGNGIVFLDRTLRNPGKIS
jgi:hypothetical protein